MQTLIINGSPHKSGQTATMINYICERLTGDIKRVDTYLADIAPCNDCGFCRDNDICSIDDAMTEVYDCLKSCDRLIFASPLYFSQYTGSFLSLMSRIQLFSIQRYIKGCNPQIKPKKGLVLLNGGSSTKNTSGAELTSRILMRELNCSNFKTVCYVGTDNKPVLEDKKTVAELDAAANFINERCFFND